jgi:zinc protease
VLPNGLRVIVQPETVSATVSVYGHVQNQPDMETPPGKEGVDQVLEQLLTYGTTSLDRVAFQRALDEIGALESPGTDFSLEVLAEDFPAGEVLLADNQLHPALPPEAFQVVRQQVSDTVAGLLDSPGCLAERALEKGLFPADDPVLRQATPQTVNGLTLQDVKDYYQRVFRPDLTTIVVIGRTTPEAAVAVIGRSFGDWKATGPKPEVLLSAAPPNPASAVAVPDTSRVQDRVSLAQTLAVTRTNPDYYALDLGNHVLGGGFYATRLYRDLREESGLVYNVTSSFDVGRTRGVYRVEYACDPANVAKARALVLENLRRMQAEPVSAAELRKAKALLLREIPLSESSLAGIALGFISRTDLGLPLDEPFLAARRVAGLTSEQVKAAFARWLRPSDLVQVTQGPAPD